MLRVTQTFCGYQANLTVKSGTGSSTESYTYKEVTKDTAGNIISTVYTDVLGRTVKEESGTTFTDYTYDVSGGESKIKDIDRRFVCMYNI